jgi:hypothetical protein
MAYMDDERKGFRNAELEEVCIARRAPSGAIEVWDGTKWITDSDFAKVFPSQKEMKTYLDANPTLKGEANLRTVKIGSM